MLSLPGPYTVFRVQGESMAPHIMSGDYAVVTERWHDLDVNGQIVAIRNLDGLTLKRYWLGHRRDAALLIPLNPGYPIVRYTRDDPEYTIIGLLILTIRKYSTT